MRRKKHSFLDIHDGMCRVRIDIFRRPGIVKYCLWFRNPVPPGMYKMVYLMGSMIYLSTGAGFLPSTISMWHLLHRGLPKTSIMKLQEDNRLSIPLLGVACRTWFFESQFWGVIFDGLRATSMLKTALNANIIIYIRNHHSHNLYFLSIYATVNLPPNLVSAW